MEWIALTLKDFKCQMKKLRIKNDQMRQERMKNAERKYVFQKEVKF